jgi:hypothetical protein
VSIENPFSDLDSLRAGGGDDSPAANGQQRPRKRSKHAAVAFDRLPRPWAIALAKARANGPTYRVAMRIVALADMSGKSKVELATKWFAENDWGVDTKAKRVALKLFTKLGLIAVEHPRPTANPLITILIEWRCKA